MGEKAFDSNYAYLNARIKGMKSSLLTVADLERTLHMGNEDAVIRLLEDSDYGMEITESLTRFSGMRAIEEALSRNLIGSYRKILSCATGQSRHLLEILLGRWDIYNIKTILRGIHRAAASDTILENVIPSGRLDGPALQELANQATIKAVVDMLATWNIEYVQSLSKDLNRWYRQTEDLSQLEYELDRVYFQKSLADLNEKDPNHRQVEYVLETEIDLTNIMMTLRSVKAGIGGEKGERFLLAHGSLEMSFLLALLRCETPLDILEKLERTRYAYAVEKGILLFGETGNVSIIEKFLEEILTRTCVKMFYRGDPLGIAIAIGYIWLKYNECINIRLIARGVAFGMPLNAIREELVLV
jgi:V/A-type H+/Na+-transporting ATPase subunit C